MTDHTDDMVEAADCLFLNQQTQTMILPLHKRLKPVRAKTKAWFTKARSAKLMGQKPPFHPPLFAQGGSDGPYR